MLLSMRMLFNWLYLSLLSTYGLCGNFIYKIMIYIHFISQASKKITARDKILLLSFLLQRKLKFLFENIFDQESRLTLTI